MVKTIGERIKELRTKLNLSADDLAELIGIKLVNKNISS